MASASDCLFCNIAKGFEQTSMVREEDDFLAFHDLFPKADTHVLVIPREHYGSLDEFVDRGGDADAMLQFVHDVAHQLEVEGRYRLLTNVGRDAGQVIPHLHWHLMAGMKFAGF